MVRKRNKQPKSDNKKEKETKQKTKKVTIITSVWVILDKLFRNLAGSAKGE